MEVDGGEKFLGSKEEHKLGEGHERSTYIHWHHLTECGVGSQLGLGTG